MEIILGVGLLLGAPVIYRLISVNAKTQVLIQKLICAAMLIILGYHVIPESVHAAGAWVLIAVLAGFAFITAVEKLPKVAAFRMKTAAVFFAFLGLALHTVLDGLALFTPELAHAHHHHNHGGSSLAVAVLLHRLPVGLFVWGYLSKKYGPWHAYGILVLMSVMTLAGYFGAGHLHALGQWETNLAWIQSFVAGSLLHLLLEPTLHKGGHGHGHFGAHEHAHA